MPLPSGDDKVTREGTGDQTDQMFYKLVTNKGVACLNADNNAEATFDPGVLMTTAGMLANGASSVTGSSVVAGTATGASQGSVSGDIANNASVHIGMAGHKLTIGRGLDAADVLAGGIAEVGFDGIGADDAAESLRGGTSVGARYDGSFGIASVAATVGDGNDWATGFKFSVAPVTVGIGFDSMKAASVGLGLSQGAVSGNVLYTSKGGEKAMGVDATYSLNDATSVTVVYSDAGANSGIGIGFSHALGGGATLAAGAGQKNGQSSADLGITMKF